MHPFVKVSLLCATIASTTNAQSCNADQHAIRKKVFLDTDFGIDVDDTLALLLLLSSWRDIEIIGIQTLGVRGYDNLLVARMVKKYVTLMGFGDIPVFVGANTTMTASISMPKWDHIGKGVVNEEEYEYWDQYILIDERPPVSLYNSADYVLAIGPLTNLANLFNENPEYRIKSLVMMGGSLVSGICDAHPVAAWTLQKDYNWRIDPDAVIRVLSDEERVESISIVTGNVTLECWMNFADLLRMKHVSKHQFPFMDLVVNQIEIWSEIQRNIFVDRLSDDNVAFLHDPMAVSYIFGSNVWSGFIEAESMKIGFAKNERGLLLTKTMDESDEEEKRKRIIFERDMMVSTTANCPKFREFFFDTVLDFEYPQLASNTFD